MALKTVVVGPLYSQLSDYVRSSKEQHRAFMLAMLVPSDVGLSERWNFVVSAPWIDKGGLSATIPKITSSLQQFLSRANVKKIERVSVLPTTDALVRELARLAIEPGTAYRVHAFELTARGIEDAIMFAATRPGPAHGHRHQTVRTGA
jgi:hypothetical protein